MRRQTGGVTPLTSRRALLAAAGSLVGAALVSCSTKQGSRPPLGTEPGTAPSAGAPTTGASSGTAAPTTVSAAESNAFNPVTSFITPNDRFYQIDTAESSPEIDAETWSMSIEGMVDRPLTFTYADLAARKQVERTITLACVSNYVGGREVGNAVWEGVLLADLLREAGVQSGAEQVFSTSVDGWTCGFPVSVALDGRDALLALRMNGEPLPAKHGYPVRLVVPGLYGYVSATKWLQTIKLTTWDEAGYWIPLGWSREAPIKTQCRIDLPKTGARLAVGPTTIAGVAWAPRAGVAAVEVQIDDGEWLQAELGEEDINDAWRLWRLPWTATEGDHLIKARTTDKNGVTQTEVPSTPDPNGASGYPTRGVVVEA